MYSVVLTTVIAIGLSWGKLKLNLVKTIPWWFPGLFTSISLLPRVVAWLIVVLKLADYSDIAQTIISDSSKSDGKQMKVPFYRKHGCFGGLWFHWKWTSVHGKNISWSCNSLIHWKKWQLRYVPASSVILIPRLSRANGYASVPVLVVLKVILRVSKVLQIELLAYISSTTYPCYSLL